MAVIVDVPEQGKLVQVRSTILEHHGEIEIASAVGKGTTVEVRIPVLRQA